jgi:hypothetical protein
MGQLEISTPALLFSAISLILLAHTNRFLTYASVVRNLHDAYLKKPESILIYQISNLRQRLALIKGMQISGISSLLLCVMSMFFIYIGQQVLAEVLFGIGMLSLFASLALSIQEIRISTKSIDYHLSDIEKSLEL